MSNEKLSIQDLVDAIAQRTGYSKKKSDDFLRVLQTTIEEGLIKDGLVKIKGFGTFKLVRSTSFPDTIKFPSSRKLLLKIPSMNLQPLLVV
jgi:nucleoid DNA-binding protein